MEIVGVICEYNPLHRGHWKQLEIIRRILGPQTAIVCAMSGNFVQRGQPAVFDKMRRAAAALECGADLVLELPVSYALSSAEGFAAGGVSILGGFCDRLCFGAEHPDAEGLMATAKALLSPEFSASVRIGLDAGLSFPAARQKALEAMGQNAVLLTSPNDILGVEYCKAILSQNSAMRPMPIHRPGSYHAEIADPENPSATSLRNLIETGQDISGFVPTPLFAGATVHTLAYGEKAMLARLRTMTEAEFETVPFGSEGLWRKFMHECRRQATLEEILIAVKSKRYTRTRLDRMAMCAFLGLTDADLRTPVPYTRVLGFTDRGRAVLRIAKNSGTYYNVGQRVDDPFQTIENRVSDLYGLFAATPEAPDQESRNRVIYHHVP